MCVIKKAGYWEKSVITVVYQWGKGRNKEIRRPGQQKKRVPFGLPEIMGQNNSKGALPEQGTSVPIQSVQVCPYRPCN